MRRLAVRNTLLKNLDGISPWADEQRKAANLLTDAFGILRTVGIAGHELILQHNAFVDGIVAQREIATRRAAEITADLRDVVVA